MTTQTEREKFAEKLDEYDDLVAQRIPARLDYIAMKRTELIEMATRGAVPTETIEAIRFAIDALDGHLGDSDGYIDADLTEEEMIDEYPLVVAMQKLVSVMPTDDAAQPNPHTTDQSPASGSSVRALCSEHTAGTPAPPADPSAEDAALLETIRVRIARSEFGVATIAVEDLEDVRARLSRPQSEGEKK